jgi:hypothetical protein
VSHPSERRLDNGKYTTNKMKKSEILHKTKILNIPENVNSVQVLDYLTQILKLLKDKFQDSMTSKSSPMSCSIQKLQEVP